MGSCLEDTGLGAKGGKLIGGCDNILSGYLCAVTTVGIYGFKFPKRFLEISSSEISLFSQS
jgi:hypothetical protein